LPRLQLPARYTRTQCRLTRHRVAKSSARLLTKQRLPGGTEPSFAAWLSIRIAKRSKRYCPCKGPPTGYQAFPIGTPAYRGALRARSQKAPGLAHPARDNNYDTTLIVRAARRFAEAIAGRGGVGAVIRQALRQQDSRRARKHRKCRKKRLQRSDFNGMAPSPFSASLLWKPVGRLLVRSKRGGPADALMSALDNERSSQGSFTGISASDLAASVSAAKYEQK
jgi:hypothetical protein